MKIKDQKKDVTVSGAQSVDTFTIKASAKAFQILSSNLYENPLGAMIRELSTNAYDAHVMVGKADEPFIIHLPTSLDPTFRVRDFGPGLSEQEIQQVYTTFFESTKTDSNDVVGCLGLGSKSPFGVSESFTINSYQNGKKVIYSAFLNDANIPSIAKFGEVETDEEDGLELEVAIKEEDFSSFNREVNSQLKYFKVKPIIKGASDFEWNAEEDYLYEGTNWKMVDGGNARFGSQYGARVIQGQIQYPVSTDAMGKHFEKADEVVKDILRRNILFEVEIGKVNIAPNRENLTYDDHTCKNLIEAAQEIIKELPGMVKEKIQSADTRYEARLLYSRIMGDFGRSHHHHSPLQTMVTDSGEILWKNKDVSDTGFWVKEGDIKKWVAFNRNHNGRYSKNTQHVVKSNWNGDLPDGQPHWKLEAKGLDKTCWILATETDKAVEGRAKQYVNDNYGRNGVVLNIITTDLTIRQLANRLGLKPKHITLASGLDKVRRKKTVKGSKGKKQVVLKEFSPSSYNNTKTNVWEDASFDKITDAKGLYVDLNRFSVMDGDKECTQLIKFRDAAVSLGLIKKETKIYGLNKINRKKDHNLINFFEILRNRKHQINVDTTFDWGENCSVAVKLENRDRDDLRKIRNLVASDSLVQPLIASILIEHSDKSHGHSERQLIEYLNIEEKKVDMSSDSTAADEHYPLFDRLGGYYTDADDLIGYINDMDELHRLRKEVAELKESK